MKADVMESATDLALNQVDMFRQGKLHLGAEERPDPVGWDVIPVR